MGFRVAGRDSSKKRLTRRDPFVLSTRAPRVFRAGCGSGRAAGRRSRFLALARLKVRKAPPSSPSRTLDNADDINDPRTQDLRGRVRFCLESPLSRTLFPLGPRTPSGEGSSASSRAATGGSHPPNSGRSTKGRNDPRTKGRASSSNDPRGAILSSFRSAVLSSRTPPGRARSPSAPRPAGAGRRGASQRFPEKNFLIKTAQLIYSTRYVTSEWSMSIQNSFSR